MIEKANSAIIQFEENSKMVYYNLDLILRFQRNEALDLPILPKFKNLYNVSITLTDKKVIEEYTKLIRSLILVQCGAFDIKVDFESRKSNNHNEVYVVNFSVIRGPKIDQMEKVLKIASQTRILVDFDNAVLDFDKTEKCLMDLMEADVIDLDFIERIIEYDKERFDKVRKRLLIEKLSRQRIDNTRLTERAYYGIMLQPFGRVA